MPTTVPCSCIIAVAIINMLQLYVYPSIVVVVVIVLTSELPAAARYGGLLCWHAHHRGPQYTLPVSCKDTKIGELVCAHAL